MFSANKFAVVSYLIFISRTNSCSAELSIKKFYNLGARRKKKKKKKKKHTQKKKKKQKKERKLEHDGPDHRPQ